MNLDFASGVMARVEWRPNGEWGYYLSVVEDFRDSRGLKRRRILVSYGSASNPENCERAEKFAHAYNAIQELQPVGIARTRETMKALFRGVLEEEVVRRLSFVIFDKEGLPKSPVIDWATRPSLRGLPSFNHQDQAAEAPPTPQEHHDPEA